MPLGFVRDAITLSGLTGTKLKSDVIGEYYAFWWSITSGGQRRDYQNWTAIVELNAATGEVYVEDIQETVLGSAGHALQLKMENPHTANLVLVLIEEDLECYDHLKNVMQRRWPIVSIPEAEGTMVSDSTKIYLLNKTLDEALQAIEGLELGNALYFFDPLRSVEYKTIERVASKRVKTFYRTGTEFIIFLFTSDWFLGRDDFTPLPNSSQEDTWTQEEMKTVLEADRLFGNMDWRHHILSAESVDSRERQFVQLYRNTLHRWFRYVLPLPFNPKRNQVFHLILCSNYEAGVRATRNFYASKTANPKYAPHNALAFAEFKTLHPEIFKGLMGRKRPLQWRILWRTITQHEEGICDYLCRDLQEEEPSISDVVNALEWLRDRGYLEESQIENPWDTSIRQYKLNWSGVKEKLGVDQPLQLKPISPEDYPYENDKRKQHIS